MKHLVIISNWGEGQAEMVLIYKLLKEGLAASDLEQDIRLHPLYREVEEFREHWDKASRTRPSLLAVVLHSSNHNAAHFFGKWAARVPFLLISRGSPEEGYPFLELPQETSESTIQRLLKRDQVLLVDYFNDRGRNLCRWLKRWHALDFSPDSFQDAGKAFSQTIRPEFPPKLILLDLLLQGLLHQYQNKEENGHLHPFSARSLFGTEGKEKDSWFATLRVNSSITELQPFSLESELGFDSPELGTLPWAQRNYFHHCLLKNPPRNMAQALVEQLQKGQNPRYERGGVLRLVWELIQKRGRAFGWHPFSSPEPAKTLFCLFGAAHHEFKTCFQMLQGVEED